MKWLKNALHKIVILKPILRILRIKNDSVVSKGVDIVEVIDKAVNEKSPEDK